MPEALAALEGATAVARGTRITGPVDLAIREGSFTVLLGPNGAGKSLTLRLLHGLTAASEGRVLWRSAPLGPDGQRAQGMVFQTPVLLRRTVRANVTFALSVRGLPTARADDALARAELSGAADRPARTLSGGEKQRLAVARALALGPEMMMLDEPTASLDPRSTAAVERMLRAAHVEGTTMAMVTHDIRQAERLATDIAFLDGGTVVETGGPEILAAPRTERMRAWREGRLPDDTRR